MFNEPNYYTLGSENNKYEKSVNIPISLYESLQREYFVGQTETLLIGNGLSAWAGLFNPCNSGVNLFVNVLTISNFSNQSFTAEIWLNADLCERGSIAQEVSSSNTAIIPSPDHKIDIRYVQSTEQDPLGGVNTFDRIVPPNATLVSEEDGKFIVPPGGNYTIYLKSLSPMTSSVIIAFGWWEH